MSVRSKIACQVVGMHPSSGKRVPNLHQLPNRQLIQNWDQIHHSERKGAEEEEKEEGEKRGGGGESLCICLDLYKRNTIQLSKEKNNPLF